MPIPTIILIADDIVSNARRSIKQARRIHTTLKNWAQVAFGHVGK